MQIRLENCGRRYNAEWIFRRCNLELSSGHAYAVLGRNGSGKSTLLQVISGRLIPSEGKVIYSDAVTMVHPDQFYKYLSLAAPYQEVIEEFTLVEMLDFHSGFRTWINDYSMEQLVDIMELRKSRNKAVRYFSSGMKQRLKLALAILTDTPILLLDEPLSNLDQQGYEWYKKMMVEFSGKRLVIVCSNSHDDEMGFCDQKILIEDYK